MVEIYVNGTHDFTNDTIQVQSNTNTGWSGGVSLAAFGTVTNDYVYYYRDGSLDNFLTEFPAAQGKASIEGSLSFNGDDRVRIIDGSGNVLDIFGTDGMDADDDYSQNGVDWRYRDSWAKRQPGMGPNPVFDVNEWTFGGRDALDNKCSTSDGTPLQDDMGGIQTYTLAVQTAGIENLNVFPNPVTDGRFKIIANNSSELQIEIYDLLGKRVMSQKVHVNEWIDVSRLNQGFYVLKMTNEHSNSSTIKLSIR